MTASLDWVSLPTTRFAGSSDQPRSPAPTMVSWPPPPAHDSAPPPPVGDVDAEEEDAADAP